jgi:galactokinase
MMEIDFVRSRFIKHFDGKTGKIYASPGRINLIGEHTDYNGGFVFPGAVDCGIMAEMRPNGTEDVVMAYAIDLKDRVDFKLSDPNGPKTSWARYIYGISKEMQKLGVPVKGFNIAFAGDVPLGAGMSSSAAMESCFACGLNDLFGDNKVSKWDMVLAGQATEHNYCGVNCGIMDQFASVFGQKGKLMRLDCRSREFEYFPFDPQGYKLVLINSCVKHELAGSPYNDRRNSCENVVKHIAAKHPEAKFETLRDCTWEQLEEVRAEVGEEDYKRAHFVLGEKDRVLAVCDALNAGDYETVGKKMYETHDGLSKEYEVSCEELDYLNDIARECGVTGSRIMGGGFGGCTINLVKDELYDEFIKTVKAKYTEKFNVEPKVIDVVIGDGSRKISD